MKPTRFIDDTEEMLALLDNAKQACSLGNVSAVVVTIVHADGHRFMSHAFRKGENISELTLAGACMQSAIHALGGMGIVEAAEDDWKGAPDGESAPVVQIGAERPDERVEQLVREGNRHALLVTATHADLDEMNAAPPDLAGLRRLRDHYMKMDRPPRADCSHLDKHNMDDNP